MAKEKGISASALVVAYLTNIHRLSGYPRVIPLFSATRAHLLENIKGLDVALSDKELAEMDAVGK